MDKSFNFTKHLQEGFAWTYRAHLSESIKKGIQAAKERKQKNENK